MSSPNPSDSGPVLVAVGSAPVRNGSGVISLHRLADGSLLPEPLAEAALEAPTWLQWSSDGRLLYAASEVDEGRIATFAVVEPGREELRLEQIGLASTGGSGPCHFAFVEGPWPRLVVANYRDGSVSSLAVGPDGAPDELVETFVFDGSGPEPERQSSSHPHMVVPGPQFEGVSIVDLGTDAIRSYRLAAGRLLEHAISQLPAGTGPRQLVRVPGTDTAWVAGELSGTVVQLREVEPGRFDVTGEWPASGRPGHNLMAHLAIDGPRGLLYVSNRGPDSISVLDIKGPQPTLVAEVSTGAGPRHFALDADSLLTSGQSGEVVAVHPLSGHGIPGPAHVVGMPSPACAVVRPGTGRGATGE